MIKKIIISLCLCLSMQNTFAAIFAKVDKTTMNNIEELELNIRVSNAGNKVDELDISALEKDFIILGQSQSQAISIINGRRSSSVEWSISLEPKRSGNLLIPSFSIGQQRSKAIPIKVKDISQIDISKQPIFLKAKVNNKHPKIQEEVVYTISLYTTQNGNINLGIPVNIDKAIVKLLGDSGKLRKTTYQGKSVWVKDYYYGIYPQEEGKVLIPKIKQGIQLTLANRSRSNLVLFTSAIELNVSGIDPNYPLDKYWIPATKVELSAKFITNPPIFKVGEVIIRQITLEVSGQSKNQLPNIKSIQNNSFEQYEDSSELSQKINKKTIVSTLKQNVIIIPNQAGKQILPEIQVTWFDTISQINKVATLAAQAVSVLPASVKNNQITNQPITPKISKSVTAELPKEVVKAETKIVIKTQENNTLTYLFLALWLLTLLWCYFKNKKLPKHTQPTNKSMYKKHKDAIKKSCLNNDAKASKQALNAWLFAVDKQYINLDEFAKSSKNTDFINAIMELNKTLHTQNKSTISWQGKSLWQAFSQIYNQEQNKKQKNNPTIKTLYPNPLSIKQTQ